MWDLQPTPSTAFRASSRLCCLADARSARIFWRSSDHSARRSRRFSLRAFRSCTLYRNLSSKILWICVWRDMICRSVGNLGL